ncbi:hypothetical protein LCGC14_0889220 [marine sediment metagenome]|uniref:Uncharacterized protein n=1 Tax=marine sediment metagenome TaxID=412755 RepID=A0A0F9RJ19_9ZZZZ|nr:hypothetical protein [bacterium]
MSDYNLRIDKINKKTAENNKKIAIEELSAGLCRATLLNCEKRFVQLLKEYNLRKNEILEKQNRVIANAKRSHALIDEYIKNKEVIHDELKAAIHFGESLCKYCKHYYTQAGLKRHEPACASKPSVKKVKKSSDDIKKEKSEQVKRKADLIKKKEAEIKALKEV